MQGRSETEAEIEIPREPEANPGWSAAQGSGCPQVLPDTMDDPLVSSGQWNLEGHDPSPAHSPGEDLP
jgi:hypothetical protein